MKYGIEIDPAAEAPLKYPCLMRGLKTSSRIIVLFTARTEGFPLGDGGFCHKVCDWMPADQPGEWEPFVGTITVER